MPACPMFVQYTLLLLLQLLGREVLQLVHSLRLCGRFRVRLPIWSSEILPNNLSLLSAFSSTGVNSGSKRNEWPYQEISVGLNCGRHVELTALSSWLCHPVPTTPSHFLKIHLNITLPSTSGSPQWSLSLRLPHQNPVHNSPLPHTRHMTRPSHSSRFYQSHNIG